MKPIISLTLQAFVLAFLLGTIAAPKANAYVDITTGSYMVQALAGAVLLAFFTMKNTVIAMKNRLLSFRRK